MPPASEVPLPTKTASDSLTLKADSIKAAFGRAPAAQTADIGPQYAWNREELAASGAYTVADLLDRVPGATSFRSGWLATPKFVAVNGDLDRVRIIFDGIELDNLDPRSGSVFDLTTVDLWTLENVTVERFANELRVHLRSWRVDRIEPYTRVDIYTGDENTNIYRGFYGKRFGSGAGLQLGGQQYNTRAVRFGGGGDALSFMTRFGIARANWSLDAFATRRNSSRVIQPTFGSGLSVPPFEATHTLAYVRAALGKQTGGAWAEVIASYARLAETTPPVTRAQALQGRILPDTIDSTTNRNQIVVAAGYARGALRASIADRIRTFDGKTRQAPSARFEVAKRLGVVGFFAERDLEFSRNRFDGVARFTPFPFFALAGAASLDAPEDLPDTTSRPNALNGVRNLQRFHTRSFRAEGGLRVWRPWLIVGLVSRDTALLTPPTAFDTAYTLRYTGRRKGLYGGLRGQLFRDINVDMMGTQWDSAGFYQPRYQTRAEINLTTRWLSRFPSGSFGLKIAFMHEYRSEVAFPTASGSRLTNSSGLGSALVEIRILRGVASYQVRNILGDQYQIVPDFNMPRAIGIYGIRWEFWN